MSSNRTTIPVPRAVLRTEESPYPAVEVGQVVWVWKGKGAMQGHPTAAIVTEVFGPGMISCSVISPGSRTVSVEGWSAVRHALHPESSDPLFARFGVWDLTDRDKRLLAMLENLEG